MAGIIAFDMDPSDEPIARTVARVIVLRRDGRVLLLCARDPDDGRLIWVTPGGGVEPGETLEDAARRELREEVGLVKASLGPLVWVRAATVTWDGRPYRSIESFFVVWVRDPHVGIDGMPEPESRWVVEHRWWSIGEIESSGELFAPQRLAEFLGPIVRGGIPSRPLDVGL
jgi:8-oxo-dGTP pyrophosphatase MutT (NUDIX family)